MAIEDTSNSYEYKLKKAGLTEPLSTYLGDPMDADRLSAGFPYGNLRNFKTYYGAKGDGVTDDTAAFVAAMNDKASLHFQPGTYILDTVAVFSGMRWIASGDVYIKHKSGSANHMITLPDGPVIRMHIEGIRFTGNGNLGKRCFDFQAKPKLPDNNGGIWWSTFKDLYVSGFTGSAFRFKGGPGAGTYANLLPHQFIVFENVQAFSGGSTSTENTVVFSGQCGQITLNNAHFEGNVAAVTRCCTLETYEGSDYGPLNDTKAPYSITFVGPTFQIGEPVLIETANNVTMINPYFEQIKSGIHILNSATNIVISNPSFGNVFRGDASGYLIKCEAGDGTSNVRVISPRSRGTIELGIVCGASTGYTVDVVGLTDGLAVTGATKQIAPNTGVLTVNNKTCLINGPASVTTINGKFAAGEVIFLKSFGGDITYNTGGNVSVGTALVVPNGKVAAFVWLDLASGWHPLNY